jgi:RimJ/RimL family protein N-acetyltransferase
MRPRRSAKIGRGGSWPRAGEDQVVGEGLAGLPTRRTARLRLAPLRRADAARLAAITNDRAITDRIHFLARPFTRHAALHLIAGRGDRRDCFLGAWRGDALIGVVGVHLVADDRIEIGYWIAPDWQGRGYATEAAAAVIALVRRRFPARRLFAECRPDNRGSWRVLEKLGFRATGAAGARPGRRVLALR